MLQPRWGVRERGKGGEVGGRSKWNKQLLAERRGEGQEGKLCSDLQVPKPSHTAGAELELVPPGRGKRRNQGNRQQLEGWTARMEGRPKAAGPAETHERVLFLSGNETSCPCQPFLESKQVSPTVSINISP